MRRQNFLQGTLVLMTGLVFTACSPKAKDSNPDRDVKGDIRGAEVDPAKVANWFTKDPEQDSVQGVSADRAYNDLSLTTNGSPVIVAVIDSGIDINHEDLKSQIWNNPGESGLDAQGRRKASNGVDDDNNGFIDDIHGWNFIGGRDAQGNPTHIDKETLELTRELKKMTQLRDQRLASNQVLTTDEAAYLAKLDREMTAARTDAQQRADRFSQALTDLAVHFQVLQPVLNVQFDALTKIGLEALSSTDPAVVAAKTECLRILAAANNARGVSHLQVRVEAARESLDFNLNPAFDPRSAIVGDDPENYADRNYGNNDVVGPDPFHGTHVAGIIGAVRGNRRASGEVLGIEGIATNIKIMVLRAVPNGDERDKDIANSVRYAVDNGAKIINMSFGKSYSPGKRAIDEAFLYASSRGVLLVHAAGNSAKNIDVEANFPHRYVQTLVDRPATVIPTWIEVGASDRSKTAKFVASFSNYGQDSVDVFAPGVDIISTTPSNTYTAASGTSMASPAVAGVAALVLSQHPNISALELKARLLQNGRSARDVRVNTPGGATGQTTLFSTLSRTGAVIDVLKTLLSF